MTQEFKTTVDSNNVAFVRMMLSNELILDPRSASFDEMLAYAKQKLPELLEKDAPSDTIMPIDRNIWDMHALSKMKHILNHNFSEEKLTLYIEMAKHVGADKAKEMENDREQSQIEDFVGTKFLDVDSLIKKHSTTLDYGEQIKDTRTIRGEKKINWFIKPWEWFAERYEDSTETYYRWETNTVEVVDMQKVVYDILSLLQVKFERLQIEVVENISSEENNLKRLLSGELQIVENILRQKLISLKSIMNTRETTKELIARQNADLEWLHGISNIVNKLLNHI